MFNHNVKLILRKQIWSYLGILDISDKIITILEKNAYTS